MQIIKLEYAKAEDRSIVSCFVRFSWILGRRARRCPSVPFRPTGICRATVAPAN